MYERACLSLSRSVSSTLFIFFFFNDTATTEIYTLSLHDALPILSRREAGVLRRALDWQSEGRWPDAALFRRRLDRKSTRLNSSHSQISYAVFCLKKKKKNMSDDLLYCLFARAQSAKLKWYVQMLQ